MIREKPWSEFRSFFQGSMLSYLTGLYVFAHYLELSDRMPALQVIRFHFLLGAIIAFWCFSKIISAPSTAAEKPKVITAAYLLLATFAFYSVFTMAPGYSFDIFIDRGLKFAMMAMFISVA